MRSSPRAAKSNIDIFTFKTVNEVICRGDHGAPRHNGAMRRTHVTVVRSCVTPLAFSPTRAERSASCLEGVQVPAGMTTPPQSVIDVYDSNGRQDRSFGAAGSMRAATDNRRLSPLDKGSLVERLWSVVRKIFVFDRMLAVSRGWCVSPAASCPSLPVGSVLFLFVRCGLPGYGFRWSVRCW